MADSAQQRARLEAAEDKVFAHYGVEVTSEPLDRSTSTTRR